MASSGHAVGHVVGSHASDDTIDAARDSVCKQGLTATDGQLQRDSQSHRKVAGACQQWSCEAPRAQAASRGRGEALGAVEAVALPYCASA